MKWATIPCTPCHNLTFILVFNRGNIGRTRSSRICLTFVYACCLLNLCMKCLCRVDLRKGLHYIMKRLEICTDLWQQGFWNVHWLMATRLLKCALTYDNKTFERCIDLWQQDFWKVHWLMATRVLKCASTYGNKTFEMRIDLWQQHFWNVHWLMTECGCSAVTLCGWLDVNIQLLSNWNGLNPTLHCSTLHHYTTGTSWRGNVYVKRKCLCEEEMFMWRGNVYVKRKCLCDMHNLMPVRFFFMYSFMNDFLHGCLLALVVT